MTTSSDFNNSNAAIAKQMVEVATKAALDTATRTVDERMKAAQNALAGGPPKQSAQELVLGKLVEDPIRFANTIKETAKQEVIAEMDARTQRTENIKRVQRDAVEPFVAQYPDLGAPNKLKFIEKIAEEHEGRIGYDAALKLGCETAISEFGLKTVSEKEASGAIGLPRGGAFQFGANSPSPEKSSADFISGMQATAAARRTRTT